MEKGKSGYQDGSGIYGKRQNIYQFIGGLLGRPKKPDPKALEPPFSQIPLTGPLATLTMIPPSNPDPLNRTPNHPHQHRRHCHHTQPSVYDNHYLVPPPNPMGSERRDHISAGAYAANRRELWKIRQLMRDDPTFPRFAPIPKPTPPTTSITNTGNSSSSAGGVIWCDQPDIHSATCCCCVTKESRKPGMDSSYLVSNSTTNSGSSSSSTSNPNSNPNQQTIWCDHPDKHTDTCCCHQTKKDEESGIPWDQLDFSGYFSLIDNFINSNKDPDTGATNDYSSTSIDYCECHGHPGDCCAFSCDGGGSGGSGCGGGSGSGCSSGGCGGGGGGGCGGG